MMAEPHGFLVSRVTLIKPALRIVPRATAAPPARLLRQILTTTPQQRFGGWGLTKSTLAGHLAQKECRAPNVTTCQEAFTRADMWMETIGLK